MKKAIVWTFRILALIIILSIVYINIPLAEEDNVPVDERNSNVYEALVAAGIENALIDITDKGAIVNYDPPEGMENEVALYYIIGAVAPYMGAGTNITVTLFEGENAIREYGVDMEDVAAFLNEEINEEEFSSRIKHQPNLPPRV